MKLPVLLQAESLSAGYGSKTVLNGIDLSIGEGDFVGVIGPNGGGKTTLIRVLSGLLPPRSGRVLLEGTPLQQIPGRLRARKIAVVSQNPDRFLDLAVEDIVLLGRIPHFETLQWRAARRDRETVSWCLRVTGTEDLRSANFQRLSGGEQQRVLIALALAQRPRLLFLDEPTLHLDLNHQFELFSLLEELNRNYGLTVAAVLHDLNLAAAYCRRAVFLKRGRLLEEGAPEDLFRPEKLKELFGLRVTVIGHPDSGKPVVLPPPPSLSSASPSLRLPPPPAELR